MSAEENERPQVTDGGVALTLIRWFLPLTPGERLQTLQNYVESLARIRELNAGR